MKLETKVAINSIANRSIFLVLLLVLSTTATLVVVAADELSAVVPNMHAW
jgi:hypothetical protein